MTRQNRRLPARGDLVACTGCGSLAPHARLLALSACCGRRVLVAESRRPPSGPALPDVPRHLARGSTA